MRPSLSGVLGVSQAWVIPGETIKGLLRNAAYVLCVDAARQHGQLKVNLQDFYNQTAGGVSFAGGDRELGSDAAFGRLSRFCLCSARRIQSFAAGSSCIMRSRMM